MSSVKQVRKVLDEYFVYTNEGHKANCAKRIHALYERGGGAEQVVQDLASVIMRFDGRVASPFDLAAAILRAIDARVGTKGADANGAKLAWEDHPSFWKTVDTHVYKVLDEVSPGWKTRSQTGWLILVEEAIRALADAKATEYTCGFDDGAKEAAAPITEAQAIAALEACGWSKRAFVSDTVQGKRIITELVSPAKVAP